MVRDVREALLAPRGVQQLGALAEPAAGLAAAPDPLGLTEAARLVLADTERRVRTGVNEFKMKTPGPQSASSLECGATRG